MDPGLCRELVQVSGLRGSLHTLKTELVYTRAWPSRHELEMEVFSYIEGFYNPRRRHSRLGNVSPDTYEKIHHESLTDIEVSGRWGSLQGGELLSYTRDNTDVVQADGAEADDRDPAGGSA